jgi:putative membrane protein
MPPLDELAPGLWRITVTRNGLPPTMTAYLLRDGARALAASLARPPEQVVAVLIAGPHTPIGREGSETRESAGVGQVSFDEAGDAVRRTRLANERTYLAWWRTGLTTFAVSLATGKLVPELSSGAAWPFEAIGVAFGVVGLLFIAYAYVRQKRVEEALARGEYAPFETHTAFVFAALGVVLGIGTITVILLQPS